MGTLAYYSSATDNTGRFVRSLGLDAVRIGGGLAEEVTGPYVLVTPTYADGKGRGAVPKPVIRFLNDEGNRRLIRGVISGGNRNFGWTFGLAGDIISKKCGVPHLYKFELAGSEMDKEAVRNGLLRFWEERNE